MSCFQSIYHYFSSGQAQRIVGEQVADLWPSLPQGENPSLAPRRGIVGVSATEEWRKEPQLAEAREKVPSDPVDLPAIERDSDGLMHEFMQKCVEIAVGQQIKEQALESAKERLEAAVAYHSVLRQDYLTLCIAVSRVSALRPWYRSEKYLAETRIGLEAIRGPAGEEDSWSTTKNAFDEYPAQEKAVAIPASETVTRWDEGSWTVRSFELLPWGGDGESGGLDGSSSWYESPTGASQDEEPLAKLRMTPSMSSLKSLLQNDLEAVPKDDGDDGDIETASPTRATDIRIAHPWPSTNLAKKDRKQIRRLFEQYVDPRRSSLEMEERASLKEGLRRREDLVSYLWESIKHAQATHNLSQKDDATQVKICTALIKAITEIEVGCEVYKEATAAERNRAQLLVLKMQWDLNGSQRLKKSMEAKLGHERQKQMDMWQDIVCAATLRGTPPVEETNIFGAVQWDEEDVDQDDPGIELVLLSRNGEGDAFDEKSPELCGLEEQDAELFGPLEYDISATEQDEKCLRHTSDVEELRTIRLDSGFEG